jgi:hypothetical protein
MPALLLLTFLLLTGCASTGTDPGGEVVSQYSRGHKGSLISDQNSKDGLEVLLHPHDPHRALVDPTIGRRFNLALMEQSSQWLLDVEKNKSLYTDALLAAFKRTNMACEPISATPYPTRFAFEFTYQCAGHDLR